MRNVITAKTAGFCFGVTRAVDTVYRELEKNTDKSRVYTFGPIVHNEDEVNELREKGAEVINSEKELESLEKGSTVIIRAHGVPESIIKKCERLGLNVVDATCPFVKKIHDIVATSQRRVIIVGDAAHPEIIGICGWASGRADVISCIDDFLKLKIDVSEPISVVAQTTFNYEKFQEIIDKIKALRYDVICFNTVCNATYDRQKEAAEIASEVEAMIVIGSQSSSNTKKLYDICKGKCNVTWFIRNAMDLNMENLGSVNSVGITAGASTPKHIIEEVQNNVRS